MTKIIVGRDSAPAGARRIVRVPGATGYAARYVAAHLDAPQGVPVDSWPATSQGGILSLVGGSSTLLTVGDDSEYFVRSPGGQSTGGRLLGPHTTQRPFTIAAVIKAPAGSLAFMGMTGITLARNSAGFWAQVAGGGSTLTSTEGGDGWALVVMTAHADNTHSLSVNGVVTAKGATAAAITSFGGFYFGSGTIGQDAHLREAVIWHRDLTTGDRALVTKYFNGRYTDLPR